VKAHLRKGRNFSDFEVRRALSCRYANEKNDKEYANVLSENQGKEGSFFGQPGGKREEEKDSPGL